MIRFLFRLLSTVLLAIAVIMAVLDASRTIAASRLVLTSLGEAWSATFPETLEAAKEGLTGSVGTFLWDPVATSLLALPGFLVFAGLAAILYSIGRRPARSTGLAFDG